MPEEFSAKKLTDLILEAVDDRLAVSHEKMSSALLQTYRSLMQRMDELENRQGTTLQQPPLQNVPDVVRFAFEVGYGKDSFPEAREHAVAIVTEYLRNAIPAKKENAEEPAREKPIPDEVLADEQPGAGEIPTPEDGDHGEAERTSAP